MALSHTAIADYLRNGDRDATILAIDEADRTDEQKAALAEQGRLSAAERAVLEAVLTGGGLEAALAALPAAYTDEYKDEARKHARSYNAGDIQVDVTGGTIVSDGDGVHARYVLTHDRNGAISVTVAEGARVTGGRNGIHVGSAGAGEGNFRAQSVAVNGRVTGGTGAGVRMAGGGRLVVGKTGRIGAASGVGVLADGPGDFHATVAGRVEGDVRATGAGTLTLAVPEGGVVTGTVRGPAGPLTVAGSIGRLLYSGGATVTVAATGALTGVEVDGATEALRSETGDLDVTVAGMVTGDVRGLGAGDHMVTVARGGMVRGIVHLAASAVRLDGTVAGYVRFDKGGALTVGPNGRILALEGVVVRNAGDDLAVRLRVGEDESSAQALGRIRGDIVNEGDGTVTVVLEKNGQATTHAEIGPRQTFTVGMDDMDETVRTVRTGDAASRAYEALPSVLLGLNVPPTHRDRLSGLRSSKGSWARAAAGAGEWRAKRSTSTGRIAYAYRRYGVQAGVDLWSGASGLLGMSAHHRSGKAKLTAGEGEIEASGNGFGLSGAWRFGNGVYLDGQIEATWYRVDLASGRLGTARVQGQGFGYAAGLEAGRAVGLGPGPWGEMTLTPRARLAHSHVRVGAFTDSSGLAVSLTNGRSLSGRAGVAFEASGEGGSRLFGSVELEREFGPDTRVEVSGTGLSSEPVEMRVLLALGGSREWGDGRYALRGVARYAAARGGNRDHGGGLSFTLRF